MKIFFFDFFIYFFTSFIYKSLTIRFIGNKVSGILIRFLKSRGLKFQEKDPREEP